MPTLSVLHSIASRSYWISIRKSERLSSFSHASCTRKDEEKQVAALTQKTKLDFDDTLQYYVTQTLGAVLVSFDTDFDRTDMQRVEPSALVSWE